MPDNISQLQEHIRDAIKELYRESSFSELYKSNAYECVFSHRIAVYLEQFFSEQGFVVDCEYNKDFSNDDNGKRGDDGQSIRPDIIVHKRGGDRNNNLILIEVKKCGYKNKKAKKDIEKIKNCQNLGYDLCVFVGLRKKEADAVWVNLGSEHEIIK
mgnify:CR=1 FL=1